MSEGVDKLTIGEKTQNEIKINNEVYIKKTSLEHSGYGNSGNRNSGDCNSGDCNSGYGNSTNRSSGIFCNVEPKVYLFNKPTDLKWNEINHPDLSDLRLCEWISENEMSDQEKIDNPKFFTTKGYLKKYEYKEAWLNFWAKTSEDNKRKIKNLPNFDLQVFEEITGIKVECSCKCCCCNNR